MPKIICISDTHDYPLNKLDIPDGDILIHAGDATNLGTIEAIAAFNYQLGQLPHKHKVFVPGNHDWIFHRDRNLAKTLMTNATVLINESKIINKLLFWGSPCTPEYNNWAFNYERGTEIAKFWKLIPKNVDVLVTHGPPFGILDKVHTGANKGLHVGCEELDKALDNLNPKLHVFGHIHDSYGSVKGKCWFVNASIHNKNRKPYNKPIVINL